MSTIVLGYGRLRFYTSRLMHYEAVMFDLDGTLVDTLADITAAGNHMLHRFELPPIKPQRYRFLAGQGIERLVEEALGLADREKIREAIEVFRQFYADHPFDQARLYEGIANLLDAIVRDGTRLAVLSNKPHDRVLDLMRHLLGRWPFRAALGHEAGRPLKPDPTAALQVCCQLGLVPSRWIYVGDTMVDMLTGKSAGMFTVGVTWGFRDEQELRENGADAIIHRPADLMGLL